MFEGDAPLRSLETTDPIAIALARSGLSAPEPCFPTLGNQCRRGRSPGVTEGLSVTTLDWSSVPTSPALSFHELDVRALTTDLLKSGRCREPLEGVLSFSLPKVWSEVARDSLREHRPRFVWAAPSTLVGAAPSETPESTFRQAGEQEAFSRGPFLPAPIYSAADDQGPYWVDYRSWFPAASEIDNGDLRALAFYNPALAARTAISAVPADLQYSYDDTTARFELRDSDFVIEIDVRTISFLGLMKGFLPEQILAAAISLSTAVLRRIHVLLERAYSAVGAMGLRFAGDTAVFLVDGRIILDPIGSEFLTTGMLDEDWEKRLKTATGSRFNTPCTCRHERRVQRVLRHRSEVYSFRTDAPPTDYLFSPVGESHCAIFELACPHSTHRPALDEWKAAGWSRARCEYEADKRQVEGELLVAETRSFLSRAVVVYGVEVGSLACTRSLMSSLARAVEFSPGTPLTVYVSNANVAFLTDEVFDDDETLRKAFDEGVLRRKLELEGLPVGPDVGYLNQLTIEPGAILQAPLRRLHLTSAHIGEIG